MRPFDPRLLRAARGSRWFFAGGGALGILQAACIVLFAWSLSRCIVAIVGGEPIASLRFEIGLLVVVVLVRALVAWSMRSVALRGAARVKSELRGQMIVAAAQRGPEWVRQQSSARLTLLAGRGLDALDEYFSGYLPQLILTMIVTPVVVVVMFLQDVLSGIFVVITLPLIPVFMALIGWATQSSQRLQLNTLNELSGNYLDILGGLATLKVFGRAERQVSRIRHVTNEYRRATMRVLRVTFLSGFALELGSSLAVALVAVGVGLRLVSGDIGFEAALFVLLLAPEAFLPIRTVGSNYHAAAEGVEVANDVLDIIDGAEHSTPSPELPRQGRPTNTPSEEVGAGLIAAAIPADASAAPHAEARLTSAPSSGSFTIPPSRHSERSATLAVRDLSVQYGSHSVLANVDLDFVPGTVTVLTGPSGSGKSTLIAALLGFVTYSGRVALEVDGLEDDTAVRSRIAWSGQRPGLSAGSVRENIMLGDEDRQDERARLALRLAALEGWSLDRECGVGGALLSGGQAQRVALARAFYRALSIEQPILILDEPTSALDHDTEAAILDAVTGFATSGATVVVVSHRSAPVRIADTVLRMNLNGGVQ